MIGKSRATWGAIGMLVAAFVITTTYASEPEPINGVAGMTLGESLVPYIKRGSSPNMWVLAGYVININGESRKYFVLDPREASPRAKYMGIVDDNMNAIDITVRYRFGPFAGGTCKKSDQTIAAISRGLRAKYTLQSEHRRAVRQIYVGRNGNRLVFSCERNEITLRFLDRSVEQPIR